MKYLIILFSLMTSFALGDEVTFQNKVYPLLKKSPAHLLLFTNLNFHPSFVYEDKDDKSHTITTLASYSPDETGSITWCHYVKFHLIENKTKGLSISKIEFSGLGPSQPCFVPKHVISVNEAGKLTLLKVDINSQPLMPQTKEALETLKKALKN